jgi:hypothetical protein
MHIEDRRFTSIKVLFLLAIFSIASVAFCFKILAPSFAKNDEEREIEDKIPKHLPLKIKIKKDKEQKVKDLANDQWVRDFELEVTNMSEKPIYFLNIYVLLPDIKSEDGGTIGMPLRYGRMAFIKNGTRPLPDDVPLKSGETYTFRIPDADQRGWYAHKKIGYMKDPKKIQLVFAKLSFGDGSGFTGTTAVPYPYKKQQSSLGSNSNCLKQDALKAVNSTRIGLPDLRFGKVSFDAEPAAWLPVRFSETTSASVAAPQSGLCCPGTQCSFLTDSTYFCSCGEAASVDTASCSDANGICATAHYVPRWCDELDVGCPEYVLNTDCNTPNSTPTPTPIPTPTPTPTPVPCPATNPSNCDSGIPLDNCTWDNPPGIPDGCQPFYHAEGTCCVPDQPPACPGTECNEGGPGTINIDWCTYPGSGCPNQYDNTGNCCTPRSVSPIIVDVDGSGFRLTSQTDGVWFDFFDNGRKIKISWTANHSTNAFLVLDRNGNNQIDNGKELFGNLSPQPTSAAANGFIALAEFDKPAKGGNNDGAIDAHDAVFPLLRLWQDANHNAISEPSELRSLPELGLASLDLTYKESKREDQFGNQFRYRARVTDTRGAQLGRWAWDVFLLRAPL